MSKPLFLLAVFAFPTTAWSTPEAKDIPCDPPTLKAGTEAVEGAVEQDSCVLEKLNTVDATKVDKLAVKFEGGKDKVKGIYANPVSRSSSSVTYKMDPEVVLKPGEALYFGVPADLAKRPVRFVVMGHRQDSRTETGGPTDGSKWDSVPGITSIQVHSEQLKDPWRYWQGDASGSLGGKFAEIRDEPEMENLYEWQKWGHGGVSGGESSKSPLLPDAMRLVSVGKDLVNISELTLKVDPPKANKYIEQPFSPGTSIGDPDTGKGRKYGGGQSFNGKFPGALALMNYRKPNPGVSLPAGWRIDHQGALRIRLPANVRLTSIEMAIGDSHDDGEVNKDGGSGTPGWSRIHAELQKKNGSVDSLMKNENVPPEGVLNGSPQDSCYSTQEGDELVVYATRDVSYIMGLRIGLIEPKK